jgi:hypothetical protein
MHSLQSNVDKLVRAMLENTVVLIAPPEQVTEEHKFAAGRVALDMLSQKSRLQPSYWPADGDESASCASSLDDMAKLTPTLYFSVQCAAGVDLQAELARRDALSVAQQARSNHCWVNAFRVLRPSDELITDVGAWVYSLRKGYGSDASEQPVVIAASINAS